MEGIKRTFAQCKKEGRVSAIIILADVNMAILTSAKSALVTYVTAGYPTIGETVDILLGMEAGGAGE